MITVMYCHQGGDRYTDNHRLEGWGLGFLDARHNIAVSSILSAGIEPTIVKRYSNTFGKKKLPQLTIDLTLLVKWIWKTFLGMD